MKAGFYWDSSQNIAKQHLPGYGHLQLHRQYSQFSTNNYVADVELGRISQYQQQNYAPVVGIKWHQWSIYGQDSWKAAKSLTINIGLRLDHIGNWYGTALTIPGIQVLDPATYVNSTNAPNNTGLAWHANNSSIPVSGMPSQLFHFAPRVGFAYDIFGNGKTVFRGGWGAYYYRGGNDVSNAAAGPLGSLSNTARPGTRPKAMLPSRTPLLLPRVAQNGSSVYGMQIGDKRVPFTTNWNATVSQALPWRSVLEISYIGNRSANEWEDGTNSNIYNLNNVPVGGFFQPDPDPISMSPLRPRHAPRRTPQIRSIYCATNPGAYTLASQPTTSGLWSLTRMSTCLPTRRIRITTGSRRRVRSSLAR